MARVLEEARAIVMALPTATPCSACAHDFKGRCTAANAEIPAEVLPVGCESFSERTHF